MPRYIRSELTKLVEDLGKDVMVVMHSYGGIVGTEAVHESLAKKAREGKVLPGGVLGLLYMCAFLLPPFVPVEVGKQLTMKCPYTSGSFKRVVLATCWSQNAVSTTTSPSRSKVAGSPSQDRIRQSHS
jgi:pimeloyl-ACP methyl ester carboxylesterase